MPVELTFRDDCAILTLNRPEALNALSFSILGEIGAAIDQAGQSKARALIITGAGPKAFCAGADIKELGSRDLMAQKRGAERGQAVFAKLDELPSAAGLSLRWPARSASPPLTRKWRVPRSSSG